MFQFRQVLVRLRAEEWTSNGPKTIPVPAAPGSFKPHISILGSLPHNTPEQWKRVLDEAQRSLAILEPLPEDRNSAFAYRNAAVLYRVYGDYLRGDDPAGSAQWYSQSLATLLRSERMEGILDQRYQAINRPRGVLQATYLPAAVYRELGATFLRLNQVKQAIQALDFGRNVESDPDLLEELAVAYSRMGDLRRAAQSLVEALAVDSQRSTIVEKLLPIYKLIDPSGCPVQKDSGGESLNIACPVVHADLCTSSRNVARNYVRHNQAADAAAIRRVAIQDLGCAASAVE